MSFMCDVPVTLSYGSIASAFVTVNAHEVPIYRSKFAKYGNAHTATAEGSHHHLSISNDEAAPSIPAYTANIERTRSRSVALCIIATSSLTDHNVASKQQPRDHHQKPANSTILGAAVSMQMHPIAQREYLHGNTASIMLFRRLTEFQICTRHYVPFGSSPS